MKAARHIHPDKLQGKTTYHEEFQSSFVVLLGLLFSF